MSPSYARKPKEAIEPAPPVITLGLIILCLWSYSEFASHGHLWLRNHAFDTDKYLYLIGNSHALEALNMSFWATFLQINLWQLLFNIYFLWIFGYIVERRLGTAQFACLISLSIVGDWAIEALLATPGSHHLLIGPSLITSSIIGGYMIFRPERKIDLGLPAPRHPIFRNEPATDYRDSFGLPPALIILGFIVFQVVMHFVMQTMTLPVDVLSPVAGICAVTFGLILSGLSIVRTTGGLGNDPLAELAVKKYYYLKTFDLTHEEAIAGTSKLLTIPAEKVREWVAKGKGRPRSLS